MNRCVEILEEFVSSESFDSERRNDGPLQTPACCGALALGLPYMVAAPLSNVREARPRTSSCSIRQAESGGSTGSRFGGGPSFLRSLEQQRETAGTGWREERARDKAAAQRKKALNERRYGEAVRLKVEEGERDERARRLHEKAAQAFLKGVLLYGRLDMAAGANALYLQPTTR